MICHLLGVIQICSLYSGKVLLLRPEQRQVYTGGWLNDKKHGEGTCFYAEGESYQG